MKPAGEVRAITRLGMGRDDEVSMFEMEVSSFSFLFMEFRMPNSRLVLFVQCFASKTSGKSGHKTCFTDNHPAANLAMLPM